MVPIYLNLIEPEPGEESGAPPSLTRNPVSQQGSTGSQRATLPLPQVAEAKPKPGPKREALDGTADSKRTLAALRKPHIMDRIAIYLGKCIPGPEWMIRTMALWAASTYCLDILRVNPILYITSTGGDSGQTDAILTLASFVRDQYGFASISAPAVYRLAQEDQPTLVIDEADEQISRNLELQDVLAGVYRREVARAARVKRTGYDDFMPDLPSTWTCVMISGRNGLPPKVRERALVLYLHPKACGIAFRSRRAHENLPAIAQLQQELEGWIVPARKRLKAIASKLPRIAGVNSAMADKFEMSMAIAHHIGGNWPAYVEQAARTLNIGVEQGGTIDDLRAEMMLCHIAIVLRTSALEQKGMNRKDIRAALCANPEWPWATYDKGSPIPFSEVSRLLRHLGLSAKNHGCERDVRGYRGSELMAAIGKLPNRDT